MRKKDRYKLLKQLFLLYMSNNENLNKLIHWLTSQGIIKTQEDLAQKLGYNVSYISHLVTGLKPISKKFAEKFGKLSEKINIEYLFGKGEMLHDEISDNNKNVNISVERFEISDLVKAINNISEAALKNADSDKIRAEAELKRAEVEDRNSRNMEELIKLLKLGRQSNNTAEENKYETT